MPLDEALLSEYIKAQENIKPSEGKLPIIPRKRHLLKDSQRYNIANFGKYSSLRTIKTYWNFYDTVNLAKNEQFYKIREVKVKNKGKTIILHKDVKTKVNIEAENNINRILNYNSNKIDLSKVQAV